MGSGCAGDASRVGLRSLVVLALACPSPPLRFRARASCYAAGGVSGSGLGLALASASCISCSKPRPICSGSSRRQSEPTSQGLRAEISCGVRLQGCVA